MKSNFTQTVEFVGLDPKKEKIKISIITILSVLCCVAIYFFTQNLMFCLLGLLGFLSIDYFVISSYSRKKLQIINERNDEFITLINYFQTFIESKRNVYQSFYKLEEYSSEWMSQRIRNFLDEIDNDKSVKPFIDFSNEFSISIARNVMLSIYQMIDQGENDLQMTQFSFVFEQMNVEHLNEIKKKKESGFDISQMLPMVGAVLVMMSLTFCILGMVGDLTNVI